MLKRIENRLGTIDIERPAAAKVIKEVVMHHGEVFGITNSKGNRSSFISKFAFDKSSDFIIIKKDRNDNIDIEVNLILYFGVSISEVSESIIRQSRDNLMNCLGIEVSTFTIHIVGMKSRKIIERDIYVRG